MKKILIMIITILCVSLLVSCNIKEQVESLSDQLRDAIIDGMGDFIIKDTGSSDTEVDGDNVPSLPDSSPESDSQITPDASHTPSDEVISSDAPSVPDIPDEPDEPEIPEVPEYILLERTGYPLNKYIGLSIIKSNPNINDREYKFKTAYGYGRYETTLDDALGSNPLTYFKISGIESSILLDLDLSIVKGEPSEGEVSYTEVASKVHEFAKQYCSTDSFISNLRRIEIGTSPETKLPARSYAHLLNFIYDNECKQNGEIKGTTFINPEIRLVAGKMATYNLGYIKKLMEEIAISRADSFLPIGGWSFSSSTGGMCPEDCFLNNTDLKNIIDYRNESYDSIEIYLSDFGWDTVNSESESYVAPINGYTSEEIQAMYLLRAYLILNGMDVDKVAYGTLNDTDSNGEGIIAESRTKKLAFSVLEFFKAKATNMYLSDIVENGENDIYCYKLTNENGKIIYAVWSKSDNTYEMSGISGDIIVSTYNKDKGKYIEANQSVDTALTINTTGFVTFVEIN